MLVCALLEGRRLPGIVLKEVDEVTVLPSRGYFHAPGSADSGDAVRYRELPLGEMLSYLERRVVALRGLLDSLDLPRRQGIARAAQAIVRCLSSGGKVLIAGNGGSAAEAQHMAAELVGRFQRERGAIPAIALTADTSILTAVSNDYGYSDVFARQVAAIGRPGDALVLLSTSGNSPNLVHAAETARRIGVTSIALLGSSENALAHEVDMALCLPALDAATAQEGQLMTIHVLCGLTEMAFVSAEASPDGPDGMRAQQ